MVIVTLFLFYIYTLSIFWNTGVRFDIAQLLTPAFGILFYYAGVLTENAKRNWFIGIRTPWTLSNEKVWDKTHKIGGKLFKIAGVISLFGAIRPSYAIFFMVIPAILVALYTIVYSYFEYQREIRSPRF